MEGNRFTAVLLIGAAASVFVPCALAAASTEAPPQKQAPTAAYQNLVDAANATVVVKAKALSNARSAKTLGDERMGAGVLIPDGLVLTIGYLILEADEVEITTSKGRTLPAIVVAYDHATGFGLLRPMGPVEVKPIKLGSSASVDVLDRLMTVGGGGEDSVTVATVVSRRQFAGYWEYLIDGAIFTSPPRPDHSGAALINKDGELVGIGSLFVMDAAIPGERLPGNMFVPIDLLKPILADLVKDGRRAGPARPWLGVSADEMQGRLLVTRVSPDGPADRAGVKSGDIILGVGSDAVRTQAEFYSKVWTRGKAGDDIPLKVLQGMDVRDVKVHSIDRTDYFRRQTMY
jgi:S1-C subfamily serine protease